MRQFFSLKAKHSDAILLFRCGDFYETYGPDAVEASRILGITLTRRNSVAGASDNTEMAGFPYHALDTYLPRLVRAGCRVAICEELEDPKKAKGLVKRGITEIVSPGTAMGDNMLSYKKNNFLAAVHLRVDELTRGTAAVGIALLDISTGEFLVGEGSYEEIRKLMANLEPSEVLYEHGRRADLDRHIGEWSSTYELPDYVFTPSAAREKLLSHFDVMSLKGFGIEDMKSGMISAGAILHYLELTGHRCIGHITGIRRIEEDRYVRLDGFTLRSLEVISPMNEGGVSLLECIDRTVSGMGGRMLRRWLAFPLRDCKLINERLDITEWLIGHADTAMLAIDEQLRRMGDVERITGKIAVGRVSPREIVQLKVALEALSEVQRICDGVATISHNEVASNSHISHISNKGVASNSHIVNGELLKDMCSHFDLCDELRQRIARTVSDNPPALASKPGVIRDGADEELDSLRRMAAGGRDYLLEIQRREAEQTGIASLKIGFNNVFGYYLEVRNTYKDKVPATWVRRQTLSQAERYVTQELKEYENKILTADERILQIESRLWNELIAEAQKWIPALQRDSSLIAHIDCLLSGAKVARENGYVRPTVDNSSCIDIRQGRHPVIETQLPVGERYVPNDIHMDTANEQILIITGPNMAGKSALLRQTALIVLMAQTGLYVPAEAARIGLVDKIFTRVGASDNIALGESTFMVEMTEAANILNNVTEHSLVLFDELGRGTSTYDGISIAWAIVEYLHEHQGSKARTLFATHYHELNEMAGTFKRIRNYNVSVKEAGGKVIFLRKLQKGGSEHSFGIHVARMAGMPRSIVKRAGDILKQLEQSSATVSGDGKRHSAIDRPPVEKIDKGRDGIQLSFFQLDDPVLCQIRDEINGLDINNLTPLEALNKLSEIKKIVMGR